MMAAGFSCCFWGDVLSSKKETGNWSPSLDPCPDPTLTRGAHLGHHFPSGSLSLTPGGSDGKASACNTEDLGWIPGPERSPGKGNGTPLQYFCLENPMDRRAWWATVHGVAKSQTRLRDFTVASVCSSQKREKQHLPPRCLQTEEEKVRSVHDKHLLV